METRTKASLNVIQMGRRSGWLDSRGEREWSTSDMMKMLLAAAFFYPLLTTFKKMEHAILAHGEMSKGTKDIQ